MAAERHDGRGDGGRAHAAAHERGECLRHELATTTTTAQVRDISWDVSGCYVATCGDDGCVAVVGRRSGGDAARADEWDLAEEQTYGDPMLSVRLDPRYATRRERVYLAGGQNGELVRHTRGWFMSQKDAMVDTGEGPIEALAWGAHWVAWANAKGAKIMHGDTASPVSFVPRPQSSLEAKGCRCWLVWEGNHSLLLGWGVVVMVIQVKVEQPSLLAAAAGEGSISARAEVLRMLRTDCVVCGVCAFDARHVAVLGLPPNEEAPRPELQVVRRDDGGIASAEALPIAGYEGLQVASYALKSSDEFDGGERWASWHRDEFVLLHPETMAAVEPSPRMRGTPPRLYVASPRDVVVARVRDADDAVDVALRKSPGKARDALVVATAHAHRLRRHRVQDLVKVHVDALLDSGRAEEAATECQRLLGDTETLWEFWVLVFDERRALPALAPRLPVARPRLARSVYDMVLERLLAVDPSALRDVLRKWGRPSARRRSSDDLLYTLRAIADRVDDVTRRTDGPADRAAIVEARAELYVLDDDAERALALLLALEPAQLSDPALVFELVERHELHDVVRDRVVDLARVSRDRAAHLLVRRIDKFPIADVARQLADVNLRLWYLRVIFAELPEAYASPDYRDLHATHVDLYASRNHFPSSDDPSADDYDSELIRFLRWSNFVPLPHALAACRRANLHNETVYVLGRLGQPAQALDVLLHDVGSVKRAVDFVRQHNQSQTGDLWDVLVNHALQNPAFLSGLLDHAQVASRLVRHIPDGCRIPGLKAKLLTIFSDRVFQRSAHDMCAKAAKADCLAILNHFYARQRRGIKVANLPTPRPPPKDGFQLRR